MPALTSATRRRRRPTTRPRVALERREPPVDFDGLAVLWQRALDAADRATGPASHAIERREVGALITAVAAESGTRPAPWLPSLPVTRKMLGLPPSADLCVLQLEGVLTDSGVLHAAAWAETFDPFLLELSEQTGWQFVPFDPVADYRAYLDGRERLDGVHAFLASRGIRLPEGHPDDAPTVRTANGLAARKRDALTRRLHDRGVAALPGARRYLQGLAYAGVSRAVVSASGRALRMLRIAGLAALVDGRVEPDTAAACRHAGIPPARSVGIAHTPAGAAAGRAAGVAVIGVAAPDSAELLHGLGVEAVVESLGSLLDPRLRDVS